MTINVYIAVWVMAMALFLLACAATVVVAGLLERFEEYRFPTKTHKKVRNQYDMAA